MYRQVLMPLFGVLGAVCALGSVVALAQSDSRNAVIPGGRSLEDRMLAEPDLPAGNPFLPNREQDFRLPVALKGFCAVTLRESQQWVPGLSEQQIVFDGQLYWFANARQRAVFVAAPVRYVPALAGNCLVSFQETGERVPGEIEHGLLHNNRPFFFASREKLELFQTDPNRYALLDLANEGHCLVSRFEDKKNLPGMSETLVIVNGLRYHFAGTQQRLLFLNNMSRYGVKPPQILLAEKKKRPLPNDALAKEEELAKQLPAAQDSSADAIAMQGYCPVTIRNSGLWKPGNKEFQAKFDQQIYLFVGPERQLAFQENPNLYIPALGGNCPVTYIDSGRTVPGTVFYPFKYKGRLYLFAGASEKLAFRTDPDIYANADLMDRGICAVSRIEDKEPLIGLPEFETWHHGMRYRFASSANQGKFEENPELYTKSLKPVGSE